MLRIVAYDIASARRLRTVAMICLDYGIRIEKSVFECDLDSGQFDRLLERLREAVNRNEDCIIVYSICKQCEERVVRLGKDESDNTKAKILIF